MFGCAQQSGNYSIFFFFFLMIDEFSPRFSHTAQSAQGCQLSSPGLYYQIARDSHLTELCSWMSSYQIKVINWCVLADFFCPL